MKKLAICITEKWRKKNIFFFNSSFFADESVSDSLKQIIIWFHNHFHRTHWKCSKKDLIFTGKFGINWEYYQTLWCFQRSPHKVLMIFDCYDSPRYCWEKGSLRFYCSLCRKSIHSIHLWYTSKEKEKSLDALEMRSFSDSLINNKRMPKLSHWSRRMCISSV